MSLTARFQPKHAQVTHIRLRRRRSPIRVDDLALMLEIDLLFGHHGNFRRRLQQALDDARRQGLTKN